MIGRWLVAAAMALGASASAAQMPGCRISFHALAEDGTVQAEPVVGAQRVLEVVAGEADAASGLHRFDVTLDDAGAQALATHTAAHIGERLAVHCDGHSVAQPVIREPMGSPVSVLVDAPVGHPPALDDLDAPREILAWVELPRSAAVGDAVTLLLTVFNARAQRVFQVTAVDIGDGFLDGFDVIDISPAPQAREHALGALALTMPADIAPGAEWTLRIRLESRRAGVFVGDIDIWAGGRFLTRVAQLRVQ